MKLNQKGVTLVELIVSFVLVAVAIVYFYQTLYTVKNLYSKAQKETNEFVDVNYAYRIIDALYNNLEEGENICGKINDYKVKDNNFKAETETGTEDPCLKNDGNFTYILFTVDDKEYRLYRYDDNIAHRLNTIIDEYQNINGETLKEQIENEFANELSEFDFNGENLGKVWYLNTENDAGKLHNCAAGSGASWCNNNKVTVDLAKRISQVFDDIRYDKYYIVKINGT